VKPAFILSIDQGTTGSRAFIFDVRGRIVTSAYQEFRQYFPKPGWVEHDAEEIWDSCVKVIRAAMAAARIHPEAIVAIGITNQRETTVMWDRKTFKLVHRVIVWQCRRTSEICRSLALIHFELLFRRKMVFFLDIYFSMVKVIWLLAEVL